MLSEKQKFAERLNETLDHAGYPRMGQGRQSALASVMNEPANQVGKWLKGEEYPKTSRLVKLAQHLGVRSNWLLCGTGEKIPSADNPDRVIRVEKNTSDSGISTTQEALSQEAFDLALVWMQLPIKQRNLLRNLIVELAKGE
jgi:transcriptional regulator with XRE-family HTH domain